MRQHPSPTSGGSVETERGLRPLVAFLDLALPLDAGCTLVHMAPPAGFVQIGTQRVFSRDTGSYDEPVYGSAKDVA